MPKTTKLKVESQVKKIKKKDKKDKSRISLKKDGAKKQTAKESVKLEDVLVPSLPEFENARVVEILTDNVREGYHHCKMSDGTTKHVPIHLF